MEAFEREIAKAEKNRKRLEEVRDNVSREIHKLEQCKAKLVERLAKGDY